MVDEHLILNFKNYDGYCSNMHEGGFYIEWLDIDEFIERLKVDEKFRKEWLVYTKKSIRKEKLNKLNRND